MAKVVTLTSEQKSQITTLKANVATTSEAAGAAQKAFRDALSGMAGGSVPPGSRLVVSDDGNSLLVV